MCATASQSGEHFYEVSLKFLHACRRYAQDKIGRCQTACPLGGGGEGAIIRPFFKQLSGTSESAVFITLNDLNLQL
jgi:hypothetical protein